MPQPTRKTGAIIGRSRSRCRGSFDHRPRPGETWLCFVIGPAGRRRSVSAGLRAAPPSSSRSARPDLEAAWAIAERFRIRTSLVDRTSFAVMPGSVWRRAASFDQDFAIFRFVAPAARRSDPALTRAARLSFPTARS
jgi:hypothetical protein